MKNTSYGQNYTLTLVDKLGVYLSSKKILNYVEKIKPERIVDIGCGYNAILLQQLKKYSDNLTGVDVDINENIEGIKVVNKRIDRDLSFFKNSSIDLIILNSVLEHLDHPLEILKETFRVLEKNGTLIINVPNWWGKFFLEFSAFKLGLSPKEEINDHKMYYGKRDIWPLLVGAGYRPMNINIKYHKFFLNTICFVSKK
jgi:ubiquinone/menaquinone biosynthesis C-methylase UbiE